MSAKSRAKLILNLESSLSLDEKFKSNSRLFPMPVRLSSIAIFLNLSTSFFVSDSLGITENSSRTPEEAFSVCVIGTVFINTGTLWPCLWRRYMESWSLRPQEADFFMGQFFTQAFFPSEVRWIRM